jgi:starvation-inducible outer membrane lipoprotein
MIDFIENILDFIIHSIVNILGTIVHLDDRLIENVPYSIIILNKDSLKGYKIIDVIDLIKETFEWIIIA